MNFRLLLSSIVLAALFTGCKSGAPETASRPSAPPANSGSSAGTDATLQQRIRAKLGKDFFQTAKCTVHSIATVYGSNVTSDSKKVRARGPFVALMHGPEPASFITLIWSSSPDASLDLAFRDYDPQVFFRKVSGWHSLDSDEETRPWVRLIKSPPP